MALSYNDKRDHAARLVEWHLEDGIEFCQVYEDDELSGLPEEDQRAIHDEANGILLDLAKKVY